jgi:hypothetical protein
MLGGTGTLLGPPPDSLFNTVIEFLKTNLPQLAESLLNSNIDNENGLNSQLSRFITNAADQEIFFAERESMEDETRGDSPATDIGIYLKVEDCSIDAPLITVLEGKRLTKSLGADRRREYVIGHEKKGKHIPCGGIERFKLSIHGRKLNRAGMIGYIQEEKPEYWLGQINSWISDLSLQQDSPKWSEEEHLAQVATERRISESASIVFRQADKLHLTHLWINLVA